MIQRNLIPRNPLMRRLQRHAQFATLFRAEDSTPQPTYAQPLPALMHTPSTTVAPETIETGSVMPPVLQAMPAVGSLGSSGQPLAAHVGAPVQLAPQPLPVGVDVSPSADEDRPVEGRSAVFPTVQPAYAPTAVASSGQTPITPASSSVPPSLTASAQAAPRPSGLTGHSPTISQTQAVASPTQSQSASAVSMTEQPLPPAHQLKPGANETRTLSEEDRHWKRLQAIMQKHEEKAEGIQPDSAVRSAALANPTATAQVQRQSAPASRPPTEQGQTAHRPEAHPSQNVGATHEAAASTSAQELPNSSRQPPTVQPSEPLVVATQTPDSHPMQTRPVLPGEQLPNMQLPMATEPLSASSKLAPTPVMKNEVEQPPALGRMLAAGEPNNSVRGATTGAETAASQTVSAGKTQPPIIPYGLADRLSEDTGAEVAMQQTMPLQSVWPVQRRRESLETPTAPQSQTGTTWPALLAPLPDATVQTALQPIPTAQPTNSAIEVLAPRRPRPVVQRAPQSALPTVAQPPGQTSIPTPSDAGATPAWASDRQPSVPIVTEIGALPSDLWSLIGQAAPPAMSPLPVAVEWTVNAPQRQGEQLSTPAIQPLREASATVAVGTAAPATGEMQTAPQEEAAQATNVGRDFSLPAQTARPASLSGQDVADAHSHSQRSQQPNQQADDSSILSSVPTASQPAPVGAILSSLVRPNDLNIQRVIERAETAAPPQQAITKQVAEQAAEQANSSKTPLSIQRQSASAANSAENPPAAASPPAANSPPTGELSSQAATNAIDMDELVRQVYANLKRRLFIEWERLLRH